MRPSTLLLATSLLAAGCAPAAFVARPPRAAAVDQVAQFRYDASGMSAVTVTDVPRARPAAPSAVRGCGPPSGAGTHLKVSDIEKIHPLLRPWLVDSAATTRVLLVAYRDPLVLPRFPEPRTDEPRDSPANRAALARADSLIRGIRAQREAYYDRESRALAKIGGVRVLERYWITQALKVEMPLGRVKALAHQPDVVAISPDHSGEPPPSCTMPDGTVRDDTPRTARDAMKVLSPPGGAGSGAWYCLLDTGVDSTHNAFVYPLMPSINHLLLSFLGDCVNGDGQCTGSPPTVSGADIDPVGHGTSSAAIVVGYPTSNGCEQGVAPGFMDSYKVYSTTLCAPGCSGVCLVHSAVLKGLQQARYRLDTVIIAEMQAWGPVDGDIANAADQVFNTGGMVIAAQGNFYGCSSCSSTPPCIVDCRVKSPANAHYAISAGGWDIKDLVLLPAPVPISMSCGPTDDGRVKPDVLAPTATWVAGDQSNYDLHSFPGTSGATPYVAGMAGLIHHILAGTMMASGHDPGMTYAWLIAAGRDTWTRQATGASQAAFAPTRGAGPIELPPPSLGLIGKLSVVAGAITPFTIHLAGSSVTRIEAALWWADPREPGVGTYGHCRIDLELGLLGQPAAVASRDPTGVFQRATATITDETRTEWELRIIGADIPSWVPSQDVYLVALWR